MNSRSQGAGIGRRLTREVNLLHANICQALADPKRILILYALAESPKYVNELAEAIDCPSRPPRATSRCCATGSW